MLSPRDNSSIISMRLTLLVDFTINKGNWKSGGLVKQAMLIKFVKIALSNSIPVYTVQLSSRELSDERQHTPLTMVEVVLYMST